MTALRVALSGFGIAGEYFHGAFLAADPAYEIVGVLTTNTDRAERARLLAPQCHVVGSFEKLLSLQPDLMVVASPPAAHVEQAITALDQGCHVVVDKPFAPTYADARRIADAAKRADRVLTVYQNRRFDRDFSTLRRLLSEGKVGNPHTFESRFEWWKPEVDTSWKSTTNAADGGGLLLDLGPHLIDQAIALLGPVAGIRQADLRTLRVDACAEDDVFIELEHQCGALSRLTMSSLAGSMGDRFRLSGDSGTLTIRGLDEQENALRKDGAAPNDPAFRRDSRRVRWEAGTERDEQPLDEGSYADFYNQLAQAIHHGTPPPVDPQDALEVMRVLELVRSQAE